MVPGYEALPRNEKRPHSLLFCNYLLGYEHRAIFRIALDKATHVCIFFRFKFFQGTIPHRKDRDETVTEEKNPKKPEKSDGITIISTHINTDFDGIASMLAAQKLYPGALVVFPGSQGNNLKNFFINSMAYLFNMADLDAINVAHVTRLVLVDTRQGNRIGPLSDIIDHHPVEIHVYDHHPPNPGDIRADLEIFEPTGATTTIMTGLLKEKDVPISPDEATILCLGIYEDTGSFTFSSTTAKDFTMAAFLVSKGASINTIASMISKEMNPQQVALLNDLIQGAVTHKVNGIDIVVTVVSTDTYIPDLAMLVQKMVRMENIDVIFALARMGNKVYIVSRSNISDVDVGAIVIPLGGGGHPYAASATIRDKTLTQTEEALLSSIEDRVRPRRKAKDLMSSPAIFASPDISCEEARAILTRYSLNALLIIEKNGDRDVPLGFITRQVIEKAIYHELGTIPVKEYMTTEILSSEPDSDIFEIQDKIIDNKQRILPIMSGDRVVGVVTRTDLLNTLYRNLKNSSREESRKPGEGVIPRRRNILNYMKERLSQEMLDLLAKIGQVANEIGMSAYVVGGFVRDLMLYRDNEDLDIVIEGDGISFAKKYARLTEARVHTYEKFGTAVIVFKNGFKMDVASARMEYYQFPAALPTVEMSSIKLDLFRRDFTINTLAIQLNPTYFGTLIDFFSAQRDIKDKAIRVLHNLSFVEDPTRVFRAIRFEQRFDFTIGKLTEGLIRNAVRMDFFKRLSGDRVFAELKLILEEENPVSAINRLVDFDLLKVIHPALEHDNQLSTILESVNKVMAWHDLLFVDALYEKWSVYFLSIIRNVNRKVAYEICDRLRLSLKYQEMFCKKRFQAAGCLCWLEYYLPVDSSELYKRLQPFKTELILYMMASTRHEKVKRAISKYYTELRHIKIHVTGKDLREMGVKEGPVYREILQAILDAKLNGALKNEKEELEFLKSYLT